VHDRERHQGRDADHSEGDDQHHPGASVTELDALIAQLQSKRAIEPPPDALERSRRAARLLAEAGALDIGDGDGDGEPRP
jgi:hypothetical protein